MSLSSDGVYCKGQHSKQCRRSSIVYISSKRAQLAHMERFGLCRCLHGHSLVNLETDIYYRHRVTLRTTCKVVLALPSVWRLWQFYQIVGGRQCWVS